MRAVPILPGLLTLQFQSAFRAERIRPRLSALSAAQLAQCDRCRVLASVLVWQWRSVPLFAYGLLYDA